MKISDMPAGPEMDRLVAEKVMGWKVVHLGMGRCETLDDAGVTYIRYWNPSSEISSAWEVVERVTDIRLPRRSDGFPLSTVFMHHFQNANLWSMSAEDAAAEICRAVLIAVGCEVVP